jgi:nicotinate dehydrogenase subunit A
VPEEKTWQFTVNGQPIEVTAPADAPLLYVLRNDVGVRTVRFGCGSGACGACSVIIDGRARTSCDMPVSDAAGADIVTVEGLSGEHARHPIVEAFVAEQAGQCGYCLPGIVIRIKHLLDETPQPTRAQILQALDGNLCRCGAHQRIVRAVMRLAATPAVVP